MKKTIIFCLIYLMSTTSFHSISEIIYLQNFKADSGSLKYEFLNTIKGWFNRNIFVETGTYNGQTTAVAASIFDEIYSIELSESMYKAACNSFAGNKKVHLYQGDSGIVLSKILSDIPAKIILWLDAHYCGVGTGKGSSDSPILQELQAIQASNIHNAIILIDDLRGFYTENWPSLSQVIDAIHCINDNYTILAFGDALFAYPANEQVDVSACLQACTISRLFDTGGLSYNLQDVMEAEAIIANTQGAELGFLDRHCDYIKESDDPYGTLWKALRLEANGYYEQAYHLFKKISDSKASRRINSERIALYMARCVSKLKK